MILPLSKVSTPAERLKYGLQGYARKWKHKTMTSEEAQKWANQFVNLLRTEVSPSYEDEIDLDDPADIPGFVRQKIFFTRQLVCLFSLCKMCLNYF